MPLENLSEKLFKPKIFHQETSRLVCRASTLFPSPGHREVENGWYRMLQRVNWAWRGITPFELEEVLSRIAASQAERSCPHLLDTVIGYRSGNWIYEWTQQGMNWQQKAQSYSAEEANSAGRHWMMAATCYSIAGYPYLRGDDLAEQAIALANKAYEETARLLPYEVKELQFPCQGGTLKGFLYLPGDTTPENRARPFPTVMLCNNLDNLQSDYLRFFTDYLAPSGMAMLCLDLPSMGFSSQWALTQDTSYLHQLLLNELPSVPWVDAQRVALFGIRFGANVATRLGYLEPARIRAIACLAPMVHHFLSDSALQRRVPGMFMDLLANRLGLERAADEVIATELTRFSLKIQGLLGKGCSVPMLSACWENDPFSPVAESDLIARSSRAGKVMKIASKPRHESFYRAMSDITAWLKRQLR